MNTEPVALVEAVKTVLIGVFACLLAFGVEVTEQQTAAILALYGGVALVVQLLFVRKAVTPNSSVAARK